MQKAFTEYTIQWGSHEIELLDNKKGEETFFIFHWNSGSAALCSSIYGTAIADEHRVICVSLLGHGRSTSSKDPQSDYSPSGIARFMAAVVERIGVANYWIVAQSISGHALLENAELFSDCMGAICVNSPPVNYDTLGSAFTAAPYAPLLFKGDLSAEESLELAKRFTNLSTHIDDVQQAIQNTDPAFRAHLGQAIATGALKDELSLFAKTSFPITFLVSDNDQFIEFDYYDKLKSQHELTIHWIVAHSGHTVILDNPSLLSDVMQQVVLETSHVSSV
jgi:pimeloyl-ACP methyl ester carboxylesterase